MFFNFPFLWLNGHKQNVTTRAKVEYIIFNRAVTFGRRGDSWRTTRYAKLFNKTLFHTTRRVVNPPRVYRTRPFNRRTNPFTLRRCGVTFRKRNVRGKLHYTLRP